jgi:glycosyltransferase involved in cell wall biosynthesis
MPAIDILLATYNGATYLPALLESLESQTFQDWRLLVRDDGSTDDSVSIIEAWAGGGKRPVRIIADDRGSLGTCGNFDALLEHSDAPYFMLCDQDDVWRPEKVSQLFDLIQSVEAQKGSGVPILAHSDLALVDSDLRPVHPSLHRYVRLGTAPAEGLWRVVLVSNIVTGCASIGNAALHKAALPIPPQAAMHDWWLALVAATFGEIVYLPESTVLYRQHGLNAVGASSWSLGAVALRLLRSPGLQLGKARSSVRRSQEQAAVFSARYWNALAPDVRAVVGGYGNIRAKSLPYRKAFLVRNRLWGRNPIYTAILMILA